MKFLNFLKNRNTEEKRGEIIIFKLKESPTIIDCFEDDEIIFNDVIFIGNILEYDENKNTAKVQILENVFNTLPNIFPSVVEVIYNNNIIKQNNKRILLFNKENNTKIISDKKFNCKSINIDNLEQKNILSKLYNLTLNETIFLYRNKDFEKYKIVAFSNTHMILKDKNRKIRILDLSTINRHLV